MCGDIVGGCNNWATNVSSIVDANRETFEYYLAEFFCKGGWVVHTNSATFILPKKIPPLFLSFSSKNQVYFGPKTVLLALLSLQLALFGPFLTHLMQKIPVLPLRVKTAKLCSSIFFRPLLRAGLVILDQSFSEMKICSCSDRLK